jgi:WD40 repeat protein
MTDASRRLELPAKAGAVLLSRDATLLVVGTAGGHARLFDAATLAPRGAIAVPERTGAAALSPDARLLVTGDESGMVTVWDVARREKLRSARAHGTPIELLAVVGDTVAATGGESGIALLDLASLGVKKRLLGDAATTGLEPSPDGGTLAVALPESPILLLDTRTGEERRRIAEPFMASFALAFDAKGELLAAGGAEKTLFVFRLDSGARVARFGGHEQPIGAVAFSRDGARVAAASFSMNPRSAPASARVASLASKRETTVALGVTPFVAAAFDASGKAHVACAAGSAVEIFALSV